MNTQPKLCQACRLIVATHTMFDSLGRKKHMCSLCASRIVRPTKKPTEGGEPTVGKAHTSA